MPQLCLFFCHFIRRMILQSLLSLWSPLSSDSITLGLKHTSNVLSFQFLFALYLNPFIFNTAVATVLKQGFLNLLQNRIDNSLTPPPLWIEHLPHNYLPLEQNVLIQYLKITIPPLHFIRL